ncbi:hypothetical protein GCK72_002401 [Caenorhabditis remanei]|uniref:Uncharacterized protein n=1 Tax=Caenorhabditis remanei TaxID=31234 RepID=A0A6A5HXA3_CAERE|nr:hypothetical protein GCK72_002401 [Caenorhabditis remanei]KAF1770582.1 hypothetical protein GCK72_002401 [Caenorhabditis remanei]
MRFTRSQTRCLARQQKRELTANPIGIDVEDRNNVGESALMRSCMKNNNLEEFNELIKKGADLNSSDLTGNTILSVAVLNRQYDKLEALLEKGANPELESGREKNRMIHDILHMAFESPRLASVVHQRFREGTLAMFKMALDWGVDMRARNKKGESGISLLNKLDKLKDENRDMVDEMKKCYEEKMKEANKRKREELNDDKDEGPSPKVAKQSEVEVEEDGIDVRGGVMDELFVTFEVEVENRIANGENEEEEDEISDEEKKRLEEEGMNKMVEEALAEMKDKKEMEEHEEKDYEKEENFGDRIEGKQEEVKKLEQGIEEVEEENEEIDEDEQEQEEKQNNKNEEEQESIFEENQEEHLEEGPIEMEQRGEEFEQEQGDGPEGRVVQTNPTNLKEVMTEKPKLHILLSGTVDQMEYRNFPIGIPLEIPQAVPHADYSGGVQHLLHHPNLPIGAAGVEQTVPEQNLCGLNIQALHALLSNYYNQFLLQPIALPPVPVAPPSVQYIFPPMDMNLFNLPVAPLIPPTPQPLNPLHNFIPTMTFANNGPMVNLQREPIVEVPPDYSNLFNMDEFNRIYYNYRN